MYARNIIGPMPLPWTTPLSKLLGYNSTGKVRMQSRSL